MNSKTFVTFDSFEKNVDLNTMILHVSHDEHHIEGQKQNNPENPVIFMPNTVLANRLRTKISLVNSLSNLILTVLFDESRRFQIPRLLCRPSD